MFFGDFNSIVAHNNVVRPIWTRFDTGTLSIWTNITDITNILKSINLNGEQINEVKFYPNPTSNLSYVSFKLHELSLVSLKLQDMNGKIISTILQDVQMEYGKHTITIEPKKLNLTSGTYQCVLYLNGGKKILKNIIIE